MARNIIDTAAAPAPAQGDGGEEGEVFFHYHLPPALIAPRPTTPRENGRLLFYHDGAYDHKKIGDLPNLLPPDSVVVFNDSRVVPARLVCHPAKKPHLTLSINLVAREDTVKDGAIIWRALVRGAKKLQVGDEVNFVKDNPNQGKENNDGEGFAARVVGKESGGMVRLEFFDPQDFWQRLEEYGQMPIPPYLKRLPDASDKANYQTIFARANGSVASPTASLHFTENLKNQLLARGVLFLPLTLHVGLGTFLPIKGRITDHTMHQEWGRIDPATADRYNHARRSGKKILALGTTSLRLLESAIDKAGQLHPFEGSTAIFIKPPHRITAADYLLTNFHLPHSTLLLLVNSFIGPAACRHLYDLAIAEQYRFYSYGDACLLKRG